MNAIDQRLDKVYDRCDRMMRSGKFHILNTVLIAVSEVIIETDILLGYATATLPAKTKLPARKLILDKLPKSLASGLQ